MVLLFPEGFEEADRPHGLELAAYTDAAGAARLQRVFGDVDSSPVDPEWPERWRDFHRGVPVGPFWVGPPWERPADGMLAVVIDPGRAFGTGAHPTTRLCLELLAATEPGSLLDIGCGSGVLAIAAAKRGFAPVAAIDSDPVALAAAGANAKRNAVALELKERDVLAGPLPRADVAAANVTLTVVEALAPRLPARRLIASGYLATDDPFVPPFERIVRRTLDGWAADVFERAV